MFFTSYKDAAEYYEESAKEEYKSAVRMAIYTGIMCTIGAVAGLAAVSIPSLIIGGVYAAVCGVTAVSESQKAKNMRKLLEEERKALGAVESLPDNLKEFGDDVRAEFERLDLQNAPEPEEEKGWSPVTDDEWVPVNGGAERVRLEGDRELAQLLDQVEREKAEEDRLIALLDESEFMLWSGGIGDITFKGSDAPLRLKNAMKRAYITHIKSGYMRFIDLEEHETVHAHDRLACVRVCRSLQVEEDEELSDAEQMKEAIESAENLLIYDEKKGVYAIVVGLKVEHEVDEGDHEEFKAAARAFRRENGIPEPPPEELMRPKPDQTH